MPVREFEDAEGRRWTVWQTIPGWLVGVAAQLQAGWLTFESGSERRRLAPIPDDWETASLATLRTYCKRAELVLAERRTRELGRDAQR